MLKQYIPNLLYPSSFKRSLFFILSDILIIILSLYLSFLLRFEFALSEVYNAMVLKALPFFIIVKLVSFGIFRVYRITWRQVGINELFNIVSAVIVSELVLVVLFLVPSPLNFFALTERFLSPVSTGFPRSIFLIDLGISILLISGLRISKRFYLELVRNKRNLKQGLRTIIIGAGNTGEMVLRDIAKQENSLFYPIGLLDDDSRKLGTYIHRVKVLAKADKLKAVVRKYAIEAVIIAIPSLNHKDLRRMYDDARECGIKTIKIVPKIYDFHKPDINIKTLEDLKIEDLIGRQMVKVDYKEIKELLQHKTVFISGAGGSIGSEIVMQVCGFNPSGLMLFDIDETALHNMELKVRKAFPDLKEKVCFTVGNILDEEKVKAIFKNLRPQIVFHAAAYKHVPMMEHNPEEAVKTNMFGTYNLADAASRYDAEKFIVISTDKAVRPTSIMGATKRMAEHICCAFNGSEGQRKTEFISVRFGNVLGSRGSVLPMFLEQLKNGDALTVTHKDMQRYFMTIPEAVSLVLQASAIGEGGEVLVLDMGEPVKIIKLAEELIRLNGLMPYRDIEIKFTGMRPGEKLFEEILTAHEGTVASRHEKVFIAKNSEKFSKEEVENILEEFKTAIAGSADHKKIKDLLRKNVKHFGDDFIGRL